MMYIGNLLQFIFGYFANEDYKIHSSADYFMQPYSRVIVVHMLIMISAFFFAGFGIPYVAFFIFTMIKIIVEINITSIKKAQEKG